MLLTVASDSCQASAIPPCASVLQAEPLEQQQEEAACVTIRALLRARDQLESTTDQRQPAKLTRLPKQGQQSNTPDLSTEAKGASLS
jgi:hypothetical protein